jgi:hypothetical protein
VNEGVEMRRLKIKDSKDSGKTANKKAQNGENK